MIYNVFCLIVACVITWTIQREAGKFLFPHGWPGFLAVWVIGWGAAMVTLTALGFAS